MTDRHTITATMSITPTIAITTMNQTEFQKGSSGGVGPPEIQRRMECHIVNSLSVAEEDPPRVKMSNSQETK